MIKQALLYSLKVWLTTAILGMRLSAIIKIILDTDHLIYKVEDIFDSAIYDIPIGIIFYSPSWIIFAMVTWRINPSITNLLKKKFLLTIIALPLSILPFALLFWHQLTHVNYLPDMMPELIGYTITGLSGIWFYQLKAVNEAKAAEF